MRTFFFAVLLAAGIAPAHAAVVAFAEQQGVRVELTDEPCVEPKSAAVVAQVEKNLGQPVGALAARYIEKDVTAAGCWFMHPMAPAVVMVWEDDTNGMAPVEAFQAPGK